MSVNYEAQIKKGINPNEIKGVIKRSGRTTNRICFNKCKKYCG